MSSAIVDIFVPTYEPDLNHLRAALESILRQTEQNFTVFIHDDASKTDVRSVVEPYVRDKRFTFKKSDRRLGIGGNWNACLKHGNAKYVQYLFQDDVWDSKYLEYAVQALEENPQAGFAAIEHRYEAEGSVPTMKGYDELRALKKQQLEPGMQSRKEFLHWWMERGLHPNVIGEPSFVLLHRWLTEEAGPFAEDMPQFLDVEYWLRCLGKTDWYYVSHELGAFRVHAAGASAQNDASGAGIYDRFRCLEKMVQTAEGEDKKYAKRAFRKAVEQMVRKFLNRVKDGKKVGSGNGALRKIALRHPLLIVRGLIISCWKILTK